MLVQGWQGVLTGDEAQRHAQFFSGGVQFGIGHALAVRQQAGQGQLRQACNGQRLADRLAAGGAIDPRHGHARVDQQFMALRRKRFGGDVDNPPGLVGQG
ncbi:hypothetical protein D9M68_664130 [compost metagenome]